MVMGMRTEEEILKAIEVLDRVRADTVQEAAFKKHSLCLLYWVLGDRKDDIAHDISRIMSELEYRYRRGNVDKSWKDMSDDELLQALGLAEIELKKQFPATHK